MLTHQHYGSMIPDMSVTEVGIAAPHLPRRASTGARTARLLGGLALFGFALALMVRADLGLGPWDVLHQGLARQLHLPIGTVTILVGAVVLLAWVPLRQRPGPGTVANVVLVGLAVDGSLAALPSVHLLALRYALLLAGIVLMAVATGLYVGAAFGPGPRDGLMTGLAARGVPIRVGRTAIEVSVLAIGFLTGGSVGVGTVVFALTIGPLVQLTLRWLAVAPTEVRHV
jgi:uncharacterized membrane protein YczE